MADVLVTRSESHPVYVDRVRERLGAHRVDAVDLPSGGLDVDCTDLLADRLPEYDALLLRPGRLRAEAFDAAPNLQVVAIHGSGYDHVDVGAATDRGVVVTHSPGVNSPGVVEHTVGMLLSLLKGFPTLSERTKRGEWAEAVGLLPELGRQTVGVVGLGRIGGGVARVLADGFGAEVVGYDPYVDGSRRSDVYPRFDRETVEGWGVELVDRAALFDRADAVTVHVPLTDETAGMVGAAELAALDGGYLVNTARGGVVDEAALVDAVERDRLAGVALDVFEKEPPRDDHPLFDSPRVLASPHVAGVTEGYLERAADVASRSVAAVLDGDRPPYPLNPEVLDPSAGSRAGDGD